MATDNLIRKGHPILLGIIELFVFIELILSALVVSHFDDGELFGGGAAAKAKFLLFASVWSFVLIPVYLAGTILAPSNFLFSIASHTVFLGITWIFWLSGAAAWSAALDGFNCDNNPAGVPHCSQIVGNEAFSWMIWILLTFTLGVILFVGSRAARSGSGFGGAISEA